LNSWNEAHDREKSLAERQVIMKGDEEVLSVLNQVLRKELTGINQYFIQAKMCKNWGYERLYKPMWGWMSPLAR
jgi:hypothetical protein